MNHQLIKGESVGIMLDLDAILDTRHGTIKKLYPELFSKIRNSAKYYLRKSDDWKSVDSDLDPFKISLHYDGRDIETIKHSQLTMVTRAVMESVTEIITRIKDNDPHVASFYFIINTYPYKLNVELITEIARTFLKQLGYENSPIAFSDKPWKDLTPDFLKDHNILYWYCYHYWEWLRECFEPLHGEEPSSDKPIIGSPATKMFAPKILQDQKGADEFIDDLQEDIYVDPFMLTESCFKNIINFQFLPISTFCTIDVEKYIQLERGSEMEKSEILSAGQDVVKEIMLRLGESTQPNICNTNMLLEELERLVYDLKVLKTKETISLFKTTLAQTQITLLKLYNTTPFSVGEDVEQLIDQMSLMVDTSEEEYLETERYWNNQGCKTIKRIVTLDSGEVVYRCIAAEARIGICKEGDILPKYPEREFRVKPADYLALENYLGTQS